MSLVPLVAVADVQLGKMLSPKSKTGMSYFPYLRNTNVQWGRIDMSDLARMDFTDAERAKFELRPGDLLVCEGGEPGRCAVWKGEAADCYYQKALHRVRPRDGKADSEFLSLWMRYQAIAGAFEDQNAKTTIAHLPQVRLEQLLVPTVEVAEQRRIAARLKAQLAEVETAQQAVQGQAEDIVLLRSHVLANICQSVADAPLKVLGDYAPTTSGSTPSRDNKRYWEPAEIPWVKTGEVAFTPITHTEEAVSRLALDECSLMLLPVKSVLIAITGEGQTRGRSAVLEIPAANNQHSVAILPNETWDAEFLQVWLESSYRHLRGLSEGRGGSRSALSGAQVKALHVPTPSRAQQAAIVRRARAALREVEALGAANQAQLAELHLLPRRLLAQAFEH